jgi:transcription elongation GreA/GreB family factor
VGPETIVTTEETTEAEDAALADATLFSLQQTTYERTRPILTARREESHAPSKFEKELLVEPGDRVLISYNDEPSRQYTLTLSTTKHDPDTLIINASKPLAQALIGYGQDDEVDIPAGGSTRKVTILKIDRSVPSQLDA